MNSYDDLKAEYAVDHYSATDALFFGLASRLAYAEHDGRIDVEDHRGAGPGLAVRGRRGVRGGQTLGYRHPGLRRLRAGARADRVPGDGVGAGLAHESADCDRPGPVVLHASARGVPGRVRRGGAFQVGRDHRSRGSRQDQAIWITGHSLGGALAVLLAATLWEAEQPVTGLYTYATPRVGDSAFAGRLNEDMADGAHWRVVNAGDLVPPSAA